MSRGLRSLVPFLSAMVMVLAGCGGDNPTQPGNRAPVAHAGTDLVVAVGGTARLIGGGSDADPGDALTYAWTLVTRPAGSSAVIVNPSKATASFVADSVGHYVARLTVSDGKTTGSDDVTITANPANHPPVPNAGLDQTVTVGSPVTLQGSGSDQDLRDVLTYGWTLLSRPPGSAAVISNGNQATATFLADVAGFYTARLTVSDGRASRSDDAIITATALFRNPGASTRISSRP